MKVKFVLASRTFDCFTWHFQHSTMSNQKKLNPVIDLIRQKLSGLITKEGREKAARFIPRPNDVVVVAPPKCGTTWTQQIMHQQRSGGDVSFRDIDDVMPWIDLAYDVEHDLDAEQKYSPRCFKTHYWHDSAEGAKFILVYREPCTAFYSFFNFLQGRYFEPGEITLDEFVKSMCLFPSGKTRINYFDHLLSWWPRRNNANVLLLLYEDMLDDLESAVRVVASFMGIDDEASITNAVKMSTFDFMKQNQDKFASHRLAEYRYKAMGLTLTTPAQRVVTGSATKGQEMTDDSTKQAVQKMWNEVVTTPLGFKDYDELRHALKKEKYR